MAGNPYVAGLSKALDGWSGRVRATIGATNADAGGQDGWSVAQVWARFLEVAKETHGGTWEGWVTADGKLVVRSSLAFTLTATTTTATRLGLSTGTYTGATQYTAASAHTGGAYPSVGMGARLRGLTVPMGAPMSDGATGWSGGRGDVGGGTVTMHGTLAELVTLRDTLDDGETWDVWRAGTVLERVRVRSTRLDRYGRLQSQGQLVLSVTEVER